jgi:hypothetical protein
MTSQSLLKPLFCFSDRESSKISVMLDRGPRTPPLRVLFQYLPFFLNEGKDRREEQEERDRKADC